jgi:hypothetical protein
MYLKLLEKQTKPKTSRWREIIIIRAKIIEIETKTIQRINETKSWFFKKMIYKSLANMTNKGRKRPKLIKSNMKKGR